VRITPRSSILSAVGRQKAIRVQAARA
jgi:hypothetical protein